MDGESHRGTKSMAQSTPATSVAEGHALKPALASIPNACKYMGNVSRAKFYADVLPFLETVHIGSRHFVVVESMDRLIAKLKESPAEKTLPLQYFRKLPASEAMP
jgi:hypothetical protein